MALVAAPVSSYSSLAGACPLGRLPGPVQASTSRRDGKRIRVPTKALAPSPGRVPVWPRTTIAFNPSEGGVQFNHVQQGVTDALRDGNCSVFPPVGQGRAEFRILWPGYAHMDRAFNIPTSIDDRLIKRWEVARYVVKFYALFREQAGRANVSRGNECWDIRRFDWDDLALVSVSNTQGHDAVFQAVVEAARP